MFDLGHAGFSHARRLPLSQHPAASPSFYTPPFVHAFYAGNYGADKTSTSTVTTPSISKNCISVGAGMTYQSNYNSPPLASTVYMANLSVSVGAQPVGKDCDTHASLVGLHTLYLLGAGGMDCDPPR